MKPIAGESGKCRKRTNESCRDKQPQFRWPAPKPCSCCADQKAPSQIDCPYPKPAGNCRVNPCPQQRSHDSTKTNRQNPIHSNRPKSFSPIITYSGNKINEASVTSCKCLQEKSASDSVSMEGCQYCLMSFHPEKLFQTKQKPAARGLVGYLFFSKHHFHFGYLFFLR